MAAPHNVELEAAKFLHKLIQESTDEPTKLARKLYVILQHMRSSGKENSMPYHVISRAMETVINQHGLDIESLKSSHLPLTSGTHIGDSSSTQFAGSSLMGTIPKDSKLGRTENEVASSPASSRPPVGPSSAGRDIFQGSVSHLRNKSFDHESPSSFETRSANSQSQERHDTSNWEKANQNDSKKAGSKRKRADPPTATDSHIENPQKLDNRGINSGRGNLVNKVEPSGTLSVKNSDNIQFNMVQGSSQMENIASLPSSMRSSNVASLMSRGANSKYSEDVEVSSAHSALGLQQGGSQLPAQYGFNSRGLWNQNRVGFSLEKSQVPRFPSGAGFANSTAETLIHQSTAPIGSGPSGEVHGTTPGDSSSCAPVETAVQGPMHFMSSSYENPGLVARINEERSREAFSASPSVEFSAGKVTVDSEYWKHGFTKGAVTNTSERHGEPQIFSANRGELGSSTLSTGKTLEHNDGPLNELPNANKIVQSGIPGNFMEMNIFRGPVPRDTGKFLISQAPGVSNMPFKEQHLKQLRAQCLVFLAFRNGLMPKKLHLEIALGNFLQKEDASRKELIDHKGKGLSINDQSYNSGVLPVPGASLSKESEDPNLMGDKSHLPSDLSAQAEERWHPLATRGRSEAEASIQEILDPQAFLSRGSQLDSSRVRDLSVSSQKEDSRNGQQAGNAKQASSLMGINKQTKPELINWTGAGNEFADGSVPGSVISQESVSERRDGAPSQLQILPDSSIQGSRHAGSHLPSFPSGEHWKPISGTEAERQTVMTMKDANVLLKNVSEDYQKISEVQRRCIPDGCKSILPDMQKNGSGGPIMPETDQQEEDMSSHADLAPSPTCTTSEKWIIEQQKRKLSIEKNWALKQQKTARRIASCSEKLKESVSSSGDISAKTKSVIELKKLQLLELQRRLRSDILTEFFKPIATEMDRLKSIKKHRIGRRPKQIERFEQRMKEERQKRIRERQKEFFSEIEVHKERLDDVFKIKRERWKGFNRYIREFHKRKERIHREKIDRIQREKINLLKINDVEGYLRMVQDAKSDRVKQLLKETEKYLQKLGSKLQAAKVVARRFETDVDENQAAYFIDNDIVVDNEDEADQAKHYLESNEKYYLMAHSIKENITEQPTCLHGGKLREYQMNGLRWLVSLYNNHLNGILADEMGLGKTVQVIALICYLMEAKNDRGPFLVVVPSSVLPGWESEINFWAPSVNRIVYSGPPEERRRLFKERIIQQKFNVLLTTYEYLMNKHDRPKLSKVHWHYIIIDEGHRIKNASCKLNADLKHYHSSHRLLLTGTPLQNNLEELWALLNFLLPNIFNSSEDFSQWFNKPFESNGDSSPDEALLSEEENLLIINRLHQVLRPFVLRRLKHKVENQLPEKIERLVRCEASAYQKLLMKRVEENLGAIGTSKARSVHNSVMELRNICNHPYLSQLHVEEVHEFIPNHYLPNIVRLCGKLEMLDRLLPKLKATDHRVLFFSTMTRLLDVMEDYLCWKQYRYLRLDGHTSGGERGALIENFNQPGSPFFIFLLSIRAGGVGVNLQAADTVIIFDTDWNPQVDLQAQARAHRIGQKKDVLVLRLETVQTVEEQVRAAAEHKLGVANQSITAGFFDNNTSAEDRREYLESLLRVCKKEEAAPVLDDDALNDLIARSESEIDIFESVDRQRKEQEMGMWKKMVFGYVKDGSEPIPPLPSRLITDDDLKPFYEAMKIYEVSDPRVVSNVGPKRKGEYLGGLDTQQYGRGKRAREVRSYEEQWTEEEFEKLCQVESPGSPKLKEERVDANSLVVVSGSITSTVKTEPPAVAMVSPQPSLQLPMQQSKEVTPPSKRGRGRPKRVTTDVSQSAVSPALSGASKTDMLSQSRPASGFPGVPGADSVPSYVTEKAASGSHPKFGVWIAPSSESTPALPSVSISSLATSATSVSVGADATAVAPSPSPMVQVKGQTRKTRFGAEAPRRRSKKQASLPPAVPVPAVPPVSLTTEMVAQREPISSLPAASCLDSVTGSAKVNCNEQGVKATVPNFGADIVSSCQPNSLLTSVPPGSQSVPSNPPMPKQTKGRGRAPQSGVEAPRRRGRKLDPVAPVAVDGLSGQDSNSNEQPQSKQLVSSGRKSVVTRRKRQNEAMELTNVAHALSSEVQISDNLHGSDAKPTGQSDYLSQSKQENCFSIASNSASISLDASDSQTVKRDEKSQETEVPVLEANVLSESSMSGTKSLEDKNKFSTLETADKVDTEIQKTEKDVSAKIPEQSDPVMQNAVDLKLEVHKLEGKKVDVSLRENMQNLCGLDEENLKLKTNMEGTSIVPPNFEPLDIVPHEKPPASDASVLGTIASVGDHSRNNSEVQSMKQDEKEEMKCSGLDEMVVSEPGETLNLEKTCTLSMLGKEVPVVNPDTEKMEKEADAEVQESSDHILQGAVVTDEACGPETEANSGSFLHESGPRGLVLANSVVGTNVEEESKASGLDDLGISVPAEMQNLEEKMCSTLPKLEREAPGPGAETEKEADAEALKSSDPILQTVIDTKPEASAPETKIVSGSSEYEADPIGLVKTNSIAGTNVEEERKVSGLDYLVISEPGVTRNFDEKKCSPLSILETAAPVDAETGETEKEGDAEVQKSSDPLLQCAIVTKPVVDGPETQINSGSFEHEADPRGPVQVNSSVGTNVEYSSAVAEPLEDACHDKVLAHVPPVLGNEPPGLDLTVDKFKDLSGKDKAKEQETKCPAPDCAVGSDPGSSKILEEDKFSTLSVLEAGDLASDPETEMSEKKVNAEARIEDQSGKEEAKEQEVECLDPDYIAASDHGETKILEEKSFLTMSMLERAAPAVDPDIEMSEKEVSAEGKDCKSVVGSSGNVLGPTDHVNAEPLNDVPCEKPAVPDASISDTEITVQAIVIDADIPPGRDYAAEQENKGHLLDKSEVKSTKQDDKEEEGKYSGLDELVVSESGGTQNSEKTCTLSRLGKEVPVIDADTEKMKEADGEAQESSDCILQGVVTDEACGPEIETNSDSIQHEAGPRGLVLANSIVGTNVEEESKASGLDELVISVPGEIQDLEEKMCSTLPTLEREAPGPDAETEKEAVAETLRSSDPISQAIIDEMPEASALETKNASGSFEYEADPIGLVQANSIVGTNVEEERKVSGLNDLVILEPGVTKNFEEKKCYPLSILETAASVDAETGKTDKEADVEAQKCSDPLLQCAKPVVYGPETKINSGSYEHEADPRGPDLANSSAGTNMEYSSAVSDPLEDKCHEKLLVPDPPVLGKESPGVDLTVDTFEDQSGNNKAKEQETECPAPECAVGSDPGSSKILEEDKFSTLSVSGTGDPAFDPETEMSEEVVNAEARFESQSGKDEAKEQEVECQAPDDIVASDHGETKILEEKSVSTMSILERAAPEVDPDIEMSEKEVSAEGKDCKSVVGSSGNVPCEKPDVPYASISDTAITVQAIVIDADMPAGREYAAVQENGVHLLNTGPSENQINTGPPESLEELTDVMQESLVTGPEVDAPSEIPPNPPLNDRPSEEQHRLEASQQGDSGSEGAKDSSSAAENESESAAQVQ
ncbi:chromatin structure-remodeling complex protein SYD isoform X2 [Diospyros lotus]|uniref:chromatin structure-remodeling complex protein SYD isoform X2 n=1 Tax=Diospyros lotus TaxID=55363 RepID=UPI0022549EA2|nr:chromatin structure-remodeling complex protein SYD isoform X2 [Diospyros lotus]